MSYELRHSRTLSFVPFGSYKPSGSPYGFKRIRSVPSLALNYVATQRNLTPYRNPLIHGPRYYYGGFWPGHYPDYRYYNRGLSYTYPARWYMDQAERTYLSYVPRRYTHDYLDPIYYHRYTLPYYSRPWWRPSRPQLYSNADVGQAMRLHRRGILSWASLDRHWLSPQYYETRLWQNRDLHYPYSHIF